MSIIDATYHVFVTLLSRNFVNIISLSPFLICPWRRNLLIINRFFKGLIISKMY